jgi:hypothetical protein
LGWTVCAMCTGFDAETIARRYLAPIVAVSLVVSSAVHGSYSRLQMEVEQDYWTG